MSEKKIRNKTATALQYDKSSSSAPKVVAQGKGHVAKKIEELAIENEIPIYQDEKLAQQLENLSIGDEIPEALYEVVAEVLVFISKVDNRRSAR